MLLHPLAKAGHSVLYCLGHMKRLSGVVGPLDERPIIQIKWLASVNHASTLFLLAASNKSKFGLLGREQGNRVWVLGERLPVCLSGPKLVKHNFQHMKFTGENLWEGRQEKECGINLAKLRRF